MIHTSIMAAARKPIVFGNWKLNHGVADALALVTELKNQLAAVRDVEVGVAPVFVALHPVARRLDHQDLVAAPPESPIGERARRARSDRAVLPAPVDHDEVVAEPVHLGKPQAHGGKGSGARGGSKASRGPKVEIPLGCRP